MNKKTLGICAVIAFGALLLSAPAIGAVAIGEAPGSRVGDDAISKPQGLDPIPEDISEAEMQLMADQAKVHRVVDGVIEELSLEDASGYYVGHMIGGGVGMRLYWRGEPPAAVRALTEREDMIITIERSSFSELDELRLEALIRKHWDHAWGEFSGIGTVGSVGKVLKVGWNPSGGTLPEDVKAGLREVVPQIEDAQFDVFAIIPA